MSDGESTESEKKVDIAQLAPDQEEVTGTGPAETGHDETIVAMSHRVRDTEETDKPDEGEEGKTLDDGRREGALVEEENKVDARHLEEGYQEGHGGPHFL